MKILMVASEAVPLVKTGGLGDVIGALPGRLAALGHDVRVILPFYSAIDVRRFPCEPVLDSLWVDLPAGAREMSVWRTTGPGVEVPTYLVKDDDFFCRHGIYEEDGEDYPDNPLRYGYFCLAAFWTMKGLDWFPDVVHCHDWQASLVPTYLNTLDILTQDEAFSGIRTLLTIHNLAYQGVCPVHMLPLLGLKWSMLNPTELEFFGRLNLLKSGLVYADMLSTVSPRYAMEIQTAEFGCGLEGVLRHRARQLRGILNGIDDQTWNPEGDPFLAAHYSADDLSGKAACKRALQEDFGLEPDPRRPLVGIVSRIVEQKGLNLIAAGIYEMLETGIQFVMLGKGAAKYERYFQRLAADHPEQVGVAIGYSEPEAHRVEAGCDIFLMPSRFEPCGLNQFYSMRYGTVPIVHRVGGLADSVIDATPALIDEGISTGFVFDRYLPEELLAKVRQAIAMYRDDPESWRKLMLNGMRRDFSWNRSALEYDETMRRMTSGVWRAPRPKPMQAAQARRSRAET